MVINRDYVFYNIAITAVIAITIMGIICAGGVMLYYVNLLRDQLLECRDTRCGVIGSEVLLLIIIPYCIVDTCAFGYSFMLVYDVFNMYVDSQQNIPINYKQVFSKYPILYGLILWLTMVTIYTANMHLDIKAGVHVQSVSILYYHLVVTILFIVFMIGVLIYVIYFFLFKLRDDINLLVNVDDVSHDVDDVSDSVNDSDSMDNVSDSDSVDDVDSSDMMDDSNAVLLG